MNIYNHTYNLLIISFTHSTFPYWGSKWKIPSKPYPKYTHIPSLVHIDKILHEMFFTIPSISQIAQQLNLDQNIIQSFLDPPISLHITYNSCILFSKCPIIWAIVRNIYHDLPFSYPQCANYVNLSHTCWDMTTPIILLSIFDNPWFIHLYIDRHNKTLCIFLKIPSHPSHY